LAKDSNLEKLIKVTQIISKTRKEFEGVSRDLLLGIHALKEGLIENKKQAEELISEIGSGKFKSNKQVEEFLEKIEASDEVIGKIKKKRKELYKLSEDELENIEEYHEYVKLIYDVEQKRDDINASVADMYGKISEEIQKHQKQTAHVLLNETQRENILKKMISHSKEIKDAFGHQLIDMNEIETLNEHLDAMRQNIDMSQIDISDAFGQVDGKTILNFDEMVALLKDLSDQQIDLIGKEHELRKKKLSELASLKLSIEPTMDISKVGKALGRNLSEDVTSTGQSITRDDHSGRFVSREQILTDLYDRGVELLAKRTKLSKSEAQQRDEILSLLGQEEKIMLNIAAAKKAELDGEKVILENKNRLLGVLKKIQPQLLLANATMESFASSLDSKVKMLPEVFQKLLGIDDIGSKIMDSHNKAIDEVIKKISEGGSAVDLVSTYSKNFISTIGKGPIIFAAITAAAVSLFKILQSAEKKYAAISEEVGISLSESKKLYDINKKILYDSKNHFTTIQDMVDMQAEFTRNTDMILDMNDKQNQQLVQNLNEISKYFGYSNAEAMKLQNIFTDLGADTKLAENIQRTVGLYAEASNIAPRIITQDLLDSSDELATYFAGYPEDAAKAAVNIRKMGMSIKQSANIADKMLDISGFMTDMHELIAMTAGGIDLSRAFDLGVAGDLEGMTKEIMDSIGSVAKFESMNYLQRKKLANTLGMETEEIQKSLHIREQLGHLTAKEQSLLSANVATYEEMKNMSQADLQARLDQLQSTERLGKAWSSIKTSLGAAILPLAEALVPIFTLIADTITYIASGLANIGKIFKSNNSQLEKNRNGVEDLGGGIERASTVAMGLHTSLSLVGAVLGGLVLKNLMKNLKLFSGLKKMVPDFGSPIKKMFGGIIDMAGKAADTAKNLIVGTVKTISESFNSIATNISKGIMNILVNVSTGISTSIIKILGGIGAGITSFATAAASGLAILTPFIPVLGVLALAILAVGKAVEWTGKGLKFLFEGIGSFAESVATGVSTIIGSISQLSNSNIGNLYLIGPALMGIAAGLGAIAGVSAASGIAGMLGLGNDNEVQKLKEMASLADPLSILAKSLHSISAGLKEVSNSLGALNLDKISDLKNVIVDISSKIETNKINKVQNIAESTGPDPDEVGQSVQLPKNKNPFNASEETGFGEQPHTIMQTNSFGSMQRLENIMVQVLMELKNLNRKNSNVVVDKHATNKLNKIMVGMNN